MTGSVLLDIYKIRFRVLIMIGPDLVDKGRFWHSSIKTSTRVCNRAFAYKVLKGMESTV